MFCAQLVLRIHSAAHDVLRIHLCTQRLGQILEHYVGSVKQGQLVAKLPHAFRMQHQAHVYVGDITGALKSHSYKQAESHVCQHLLSAI